MEILQPSWRGRDIQTRKDSGGKYTAMVGAKSLLYVPISILPKAVYKITAELCNESGTGIIYCNIYGNKKHDFKASRIKCEEKKWATFDVDVVTGEFPKTLPMMFRVWRGKDGTGTILIRKFIVELIEGEVKAETEGKIILNNLAVPAPPPAPPSVPSKKPKPRPRIGKSKKNAELFNGSHTQPFPQEQNKGQDLIEEELFPPPPKIKELVSGEDGIKNSVIISIKNRKEFLDRTLYFYNKQTMPKEEFEIVILDDGSKQDLLSVCKKHSSLFGLRFQYIRVDSTKGAVRQEGWTPALTNNIGFKKARGSVLIITGPETIQKETNMEKTWEACDKPICLYGLVHKSDHHFVNYLKSDTKWYEKSFLDLLYHSKHKFIKPNTSGFWWYYAAARKEYIMAINGVDEQYMLGMCGEDDDFAARMRFLGLRLIHDPEILGIHQDHSKEDRKDSDHKVRFDRKTWRKLRNHNLTLLRRCKNKRSYVANQTIDWGKEEAIVDIEVF